MISEEGKGERPQILPSPFWSTIKMEVHFRWIFSSGFTRRICIGVMRIFRFVWTHIPCRRLHLVVVTFVERSHRYGLFTFLCKPSVYNNLCLAIWPFGGFYGDHICFVPTSWFLRFKQVIHLCIARANTLVACLRISPIPA